MVNILLHNFCDKYFLFFTFANCIEKLRLRCVKMCKLLAIKIIM